MEGIYKLGVAGGLVVIIIGFPIVIPSILCGVGLKILAFLGVTSALGYLLNIFKGK